VSESRTHILYIAEFSTGGSIESLLCLVSGLNSLDFQATVLFYTTPDAAICERVEAAGATLLSLYPRNSNKDLQKEFKKHNLQTKIRKVFGRRIERSYESLKFALEFFRFQRPTYRAIRRQLDLIQPDLVHLNNGADSDTPGILAARASGIPTVCHIRAFGRLTYLSIVAARSVKSFICISSAVRDHLTSYGIDADKCVVVPNAVDLQRFSEQDTPAADIRAENSWESTDKVFVLVGRIVSWKGQDFFIRAIAEARKSDKSVHGLIVGEGESTAACETHFAGLEPLVCELGLEPFVRFAGHRTDIPNIMKSADAVICASSLPEPFGRVIIESMAVGTPVVATNAGGTPDIISDGENGLLVPIRDSNALANAILRLSRDNNLVQKIRSAGLLSATELYTVERHAECISEIYRSVLKLQQD